MFLKKEKKEKVGLDIVITLIVLSICIFGIIMLYSSSQMYSTNMFNDDTYLVRKQGIIMIVGIILSFLISNIDYKIYYHTSKLIYGFAFIFLIATTLATSMRGVNRWLSLSGISFQPSEFVKLAMIIFIPRVLIDNDFNLVDKDIRFRVFAISLVPTIVVALNNLSTGIIIFLITFAVIYVVSEKKVVYLVALLLIIVIYIRRKNILCSR